MTHYDVYDSPLGALTLSTDDDEYITGLHIEGDRYFTAVPSGWVRDVAQPVLKQVRRELSEYFAGQRHSFSVPVRAAGTPFQMQVWAALQRLNPGQTTTYTAISQAIGKPKAVRAVGTAVGRNPVCIIVPCHRVMASDGSLGGFVAGLPAKRQLLAIEQ